ncbi:MAG: PKD domain-containing protein, partial [Candidatus Gracilibacteria bacterium]
MMKNTKIKKIIISGLLSLAVAGLFGFIPAAHAADDWCSGITDGIVDCGGGDSNDVVSFVGFEGGLTAPTCEGLDSTLTKAKSAREFIVNTVNFALSFLGLIAMVIIIYGGFLYVTAAGNEEQSGKGKKAITYAAVGIVIIIASFAIVNTLLSFGGGATDGSTGSGTLRTAGQEGTNIGQQSIYNFGATEVNSSLSTFIAAYKNLLNVNGAIKKINTVPQPDKETDNKTYLNDLSTAISQIKNNAPSLSKTYMACRSIIDGWISQMSVKDLTAQEYRNGQLKASFLPELNKIKAASDEDFTTVIKDLTAKLTNVKKILGDITDAPLSNYTGRNFNTDKNMQKAFAGIDMTKPVKEVFDEAMKDVEAAIALKDDPENVGLVVNVAQSLNRLFIVAKNIEFVFVRVKATVREGNAPLIVELNGLDSRDPTGDTIADDRYEWDPEGSYSEESNKNNTAKADCNTRQSSVIVCTYNQPGTYVVRLKVKSSDPSRIATGQAYLPITVLPSIARIAMKATAGGITEDLRKYEQDAENKSKWNLIVDKSEFQVTTSEAKTSGIAFDASQSQAGSGANIQSYEWTFGEGSSPEKTPTVKHQYRTEGKFPLKLEVTDSGGRKDRKLVNIIIASIAARIQLNKTIAEPDELIELDGSISKSDRGSISSYIWKIMKGDEDVTALQNLVSIVGDSNSSVFRFKLKTPGTYSVSLEVSDGSMSATRTETISIKSRKPRANFSVRACPEDCPNPSTPNVIELDASTSYDPDKDPLIYTWHIFGDTGDEITEGTIFTELNGNPIYGPDAKKVSLKFNKVGKYRIQMALQDDLPDELMQTDIKEKNIEIKSIVEAYWDEDLSPVSQLTAGKATFMFSGKATNASLLKWDFGDGFTTDTSVDASQDGNFSFSHDYSTAGTFLVKLRAIAEDGSGENEISKRVYIANGDSPLAAMEVSVNGVPFVIDGTPLEIIRNKVIKFDASYSLDSKGKTGGLKFSWDFGDQKKSTGAKVEHAYEDVSPDAPFTVTLTVTENADATKTSQATFEVSVISKKPIVNTLSIERKTTGEKTPVDVLLTAEGAQDPDGRVANYQFWYYDPADKEQKLAVIDTPSDHAVLTVETNGEESQEHEYFFCVSVTDNENTVSSCEDLFDESELPKIKVKNGPNKAPVAAFSVDRTNVKVNEDITFTSSSKDEDGRIAQYIWDTEGDGFQNDNPTELSTITYKYPRKSPRGGYRVKLKIIDDKGAAGFSKEQVINVETKSTPPVANFTYLVQENRQVKFIDSSTFDTTNGAKPAKWTWDFDTSQEFGCTGDPQNKPKYCNGNKSDDADSTDQNPIYPYTTSGTYQVKLTVEDSDGNVSEPKTALINLIAGMSGGSNGASPTANVLKADLRTDPMFKYETKDARQSKVIHLPANSNGQNITLFWGSSTGDIKEYKIDKNTWCDSDGNGGSNGRADDVNNPTLIGATCLRASTGEPADNCWTTNYSRFAKTGNQKGPGNFTT